jgi:hypothetical protein
MDSEQMDSEQMDSKQMDSEQMDSEQMEFAHAGGWILILGIRRSTVHCTKRIRHVETIHFIRRDEKCEGNSNFV